MSKADETCWDFVGRFFELLDTHKEHNSGNFANYYCDAQTLEKFVCRQLAELAFAGVSDIGFRQSFKAATDADGISL